MNSVETPQSRCRFGIAVGDITPPVGMYHRMWGAARHDRSTGIHRPLRATAAVFRALTASAGPETEQVLVALDHCILGPAELERIVRAITAENEIVAEQIAVVCAHTHAAGLLSLDRADLPGGELISDYLDRLSQTVAELVATARHDCQPATIVYGVGRCDLAAYRDYWDDAHGRYVCGYDPAGTADDTVLVAKVQGEDGRTLATVVNYACHPTTLAWDNTLISPDYPGAMREAVEAATGASCLFLQGASGELGPREGFTGDVKIADRNGRQLGHAALSALTALPPPRTRYV
ncbi:MAG: neutral/alkaline non-lysosomal ceramidase N-terminal domain-containing protein, partial [Planctomycetaceae bacterium]